jgi:hypothetical protein
MSMREAADSSPDWDATTYDRVADPQTRWGTAVLDRLPLQGDETVIDANEAVIIQTPTAGGYGPP